MALEISDKSTTSGPAFAPAGPPANTLPDSRQSDRSNAASSDAVYTGQQLTAQELLTEYQKGTRTFLGADSCPLDLKQLQLGGADLRKVRLPEANLTGACLSDAKLIQAVLRGASLADADLTRADLTNADLSNANLARANLTGATLVGANLDRADLTGAVLVDAKLEGADLTNVRARRAEFDGSSIEDARLTGSDLLDAKAASAIATFESRKSSLLEAAKALRLLSLASISFLTYSLISVTTSRDDLVLANTGTMDIPLLNAKVSPHAFFLSTCGVGFCLVLFLQLHLVTLCNTVASLPSRFPGGYRLHLSEILDPWVVRYLDPEVDSSTSSRPSGGRFESEVVSLLRDRLPRLLVRWLLPLAIAATGWRFAASQSSVQSWLLAVLYVLSIAAMVVFSRYNERILGLAPQRLAWTLFPAAIIGLCAVSRIMMWRMFGPYWPDGLQYAALEGIDLSRSNFSGTNMFRARLAGSTLAHSALVGAYLHESDLHGGDLRDVDATGAWMPAANGTGIAAARARFRNANLRSAKFEGASMGEADFTAARLQYAHFEHAGLWKVTLNHTMASGADFEAARLSASAINGAFLDGANLAHAQLWGITWSNVLLDRANLDGALLSTTSVVRNSRLIQTSLANVIMGGATFENCEFDKATGAGASFWGADFRSSSFNKAQLPNANFATATIDHSTFDKANLTGASMWSIGGTNLSFAGATLKTANFSEATLTKVRFTKADLEGASIFAAILDEVDFEGAKLIGANLQGTDMSRCTGLTMSQVRSAATPPLALPKGIPE